MTITVATAFRSPARARFTDGWRYFQAAPGAYRGVGTESFALLRPGRVLGQKRRPVVVYCHGLLGFGIDAAKGSVARQLGWLARAGYPVISADLGGPATWGIDDTKTAIDQALAYTTSQFGIDTSRVALFMESMGFTVGVPWIAAGNVARTVWAYGIVPVADMAAVAARPQNAALAASMHGAYGSQAAWTAALPTHNPVASGLTSKLHGLGPRFRIDADQDDTINLPVDYETFRTAVPGTDVRYWPGQHLAISRMTAGRDVAMWADRMSENEP